MCPADGTSSVRGYLALLNHIFCIYATQFAYLPWAAFVTETYFVRCAGESRMEGTRNRFIEGMKWRDWEMNRL